MFSTSLHSKRRPVRIAVSMGDPAGVGLECFLRLLREKRLPKKAQYQIFAVPEVVEEGVKRLLGGTLPSSVKVVPVDSGGASLAKLLTPQAPESHGPTFRALREAALAVLQGEADALVTLPITKGIFKPQGLPYLGHTHYLAALCGEVFGGHHQALMTMVGPSLRVAVLTDHIPLAQVGKVVTPKGILWALEVLQRDSAQLGLPQPRIAVCGLNPHAGEGGTIGTEDDVQVAPAIIAGRALGINVVGPLAGDSLFYQARQGAYDWVVALYHDQGLGPVKTLAFYETVNVTLGLPLIRTSPDHGVAYDLVGKDVADTTSVKLSVQLAISMAEKKRGSC